MTYLLCSLLSGVTVILYFLSSMVLKIFHIFLFLLLHHGQKQKSRFILLTDIYPVSIMQGAGNNMLNKTNMLYSHQTCILTGGRKNISSLSSVSMKLDGIKSFLGVVTLG